MIQVANSSVSTVSSGRGERRACSTLVVSDCTADIGERMIDDILHVHSNPAPAMATTTQHMVTSDRNGLPLMHAAGGAIPSNCSSVIPKYSVRRNAGVL